MKYRPTIMNMMPVIFLVYFSSAVTLLNQCDSEENPRAIPKEKANTGKPVPSMKVISDKLNTFVLCVFAGDSNLRKSYERK
ncbi:MAG: hypothetical protein KAJ66_01410 [Candidatus Omnitrophica bacterium]|nr:hypothetical protein [Candidatus Omnitrophota bacterium]